MSTAPQEQSVPVQTNLALMLLGTVGGLVALTFGRLLQAGASDVEVTTTLGLAALGPAAGVLLEPRSKGFRGFEALLLIAAAALALHAWSWLDGQLAAAVSGLLLAVALRPLGDLAARCPVEPQVMLALPVLGAGVGAAAALLLGEHVGPAAMLTGAGFLAAVAVALLGGPLISILALGALLVVPRLQAAMLPEINVPQSKGELRLERWDGLGQLQLRDVHPGASALAREGGAMTPWLDASDAAGRAQLARVCEATLQATPHFRPRHRVAVLGGEGALDVQCALHHGATRVDWVIARRGLATLAERQWGRLGLDDAVRIVRASPRRYLASSEGGYDLVVVPTARSRHPAPMPLLPATTLRLHTREGIGAMARALAPNGVLTMGASGEPATFALLRTAMAAVGGDAPQRHLVVAQGGGSYLIMLRQHSLPSDEVIALRDVDARQKTPLSPELIRAAPWSLGPAPVVRFTPVVPRPNRVSVFLARMERGELDDYLARYTFAVPEGRDDRPRVFDQSFYREPSRWTLHTPAVRLLLLVGSVLLLALLLLVTARKQIPLGTPGVSAIGLGALCPLGFAAAAHWLEGELGMLGDGFALAALSVAALIAVGVMRMLGLTKPDALRWLTLGASVATPWPSLIVGLSGHVALVVVGVGIVALTTIPALLSRRSSTG